MKNRLFYFPSDNSWFSINHIREHKLGQLQCTIDLYHYDLPSSNVFRKEPEKGGEHFICCMEYLRKSIGQAILHVISEKHLTEKNLNIFSKPATSQSCSVLDWYDFLNCEVVRQFEVKLYWKQQMLPRN